MTTNVLLIRHASHDRLGRILCGRTAGVTLSAAGRAEAGALANGLRERDTIDALYASPLERARETAEPIGLAFGLPVEIDPGLDEVDFGAWSGRSFEALGADPLWPVWNQNRDQTRPPGGETIIEAQVRAVRCIERLGRQHPASTVALVSHADLIKTAIAWALGLPLAFYARFEISPASVSRLVVFDGGVKVWSVNRTLGP